MSLSRHTSFAGFRQLVFLMLLLFLLVFFVLLFIFFLQPLKPIL